MDPFLQSAITFGVGLGALLGLVIFITPIFDRIAARIEGRDRPLPPAE